VLKAGTEWNGTNQGARLVEMDLVSIHMVVCRAVKKSQHATPVSILRGRTIMHFSHICNFMLLVQN